MTCWFSFFLCLLFCCGCLLVSLFGWAFGLCVRVLLLLTSIFFKYVSPTPVNTYFPKASRMSGMHRKRPYAVVVAGVPVGGGGGGPPQAQVVRPPPKKKTGQLKRNGGKTTGLFVRVLDKNGKPTSEIDHELLGPPVCQSAHCKLACCTVIADFPPDERADFVRNARDLYRDAYLQNKKLGENVFLQFCMVPKSLQAPRKKWFQARKKVQFQPPNTGEKRRLCSWCQTLEDVDWKDCLHMFKNKLCPRFAEATKWHHENPPASEMSYVLPPVNNYKLLQVSRTYFQTLFCVGSTKLRNVIEAVRTRDMGKLRATSGVRKKKLQ